MNAKIVVLFNHKGGVSKTTTTYNLGWMLTEFGKKVLFVDGDPQCNLTELFLHDKFDDYYLNEDTKNQNLKDALAVAFEGKPRPIEAINCFTPDNNNRAFLIPGHMDLAEYESSLSLALNSNNAIVTLQNLPGSFYELIRLCCEKYGIDYVLIDMNPGLSAINQTFLMISDAFIVPTNPDPFSTMALKTLKGVLPRWKRQAQNARMLFQDASYPLPETEIKFIGEIIQRFNLRNQKAARPYVGKIEEIKAYIENEFVPTLAQLNMVYDITPLQQAGLLQDHCLAEISEFGALLQKANDNAVPVFALTKEQIGERGPILEQMEANRVRFHGIIENVARVVMELVQ